MLKKYDSIVNSNIKNELTEAEWAEDLIQFAAYKCQIDGLIAAGALFCPEIVCVRDYVFIKKFLHCEEGDIYKFVSDLEKQYKYNKQEIEKSVNTWSLGDLFLGDNSYEMDNEEVLKQFGEMLCYFWKMRVNQLFPNKNIIVELGNNIMGEYGLCITLYEKYSK